MGHDRRDVEEGFETDLKARAILPVLADARRERRTRRRRAYLGDNLTYFSKVLTSAEVALREEVLDKPCTDVVPHLLELLVDLIVVFVVLDELHYERAIGEGEEFRVLEAGSLVYTRSRCHMGDVALTVFSGRLFQMSSPMALYCLLEVAMIVH